MDHYKIYDSLQQFVKPMAEKMEYISHVADGSDGYKIKNGYWLLGAAAINIQSEDEAIKIIISYFSRWPVEETYKFIINKHVKRLKKAPYKLFNWLNRAADAVSILFKRQRVALYT